MSCVESCELILASNLLNVDLPPFVNSHLELSNACVQV